MQEEWRPIVGYEDIYEISSMGRVRSKERLVKHSGNNLRKVTPKYLTPYPASNSNQLVVQFYGNGRKCQRSILNLMYTAFIGPIPAKHSVITIDGDASGLRLDNIRLIPGNSNNVSLILPEVKKKELASLRAKGVSYKELTKMSGISKTTLYDMFKNLSRFIPRNYQKIAIDHIMGTARCAVWMDMGLGKTATVLEALDRLALTDRSIYPALIVAPLRVAKSVWPLEIEKWENFKHLTCTPIHGESHKRLEALNTKSDIYTINYENIVWLINHLKADWPFKTVVVDESTRFKNLRFSSGSKYANTFAKVAHKSIDRLIELTGTPSPNGVKDIWGQIWFLDAGKRLGRTYEEFNRSYVCDKDIVESLEAKLKDIVISIRTADYFNVREPIINNIYVDLPPAALNLYKQMEDQMFIELEKQPITAVNGAAKSMKCLQLANGAAYLSGSKKWAHLHDAKVKALEDIVEEASGMPVLVAYNFKSDLERLLRTFPKGRHLDKSPDTIADWNAGKIPILFAHPASAGHGLNLQDGGNIIAFFGHSWNLEHYQQMVERIGPARQLQSGYNRAVFVHHIIARNTVDELVILRRETKRAIQDILREAMKQRKRYA